MPRNPLPNAKREFDGALGQHVVAFVAEDPAGVLRRFQRLTHRSSPCRAGCRPPSTVATSTPQPASLMPSAQRRTRAARALRCGPRQEWVTYRQDKCSRRPLRPASRHYGYGEVRSATTKSGRRKIAQPVVAAISQNSVSLQGTQNRTPPTIPCRGALPALSVAAKWNGAGELRPRFIGGQIAPSSPTM